MTAGPEAARYDGPAAIIQDGNVVLVLCSLPAEAFAPARSPWSGRFKVRDPGDEVDIGAATLRLASGVSLSIVVTGFSADSGTLAGVG